MQTITKVALDAMGGDNAPAEIVKGAVDAVSSREDIKVFLVGQEDVVREELQKYPYPQERIEVVDAPEVIEMAEPPVQAIRKKKQSSLVVGMNMVKQREADAFVSAGSSGADCRTHPWNQTPTAGTDHSDGDRNFTVDRLWRKCGRTAGTFITVCKDGFRLYGKRCGD